MPKHTIKILGKGCGNCIWTERLVREVIAQLGVEVEVHRRVPDNLAVEGFLRRLHAPAMIIVAVRDDDVLDPHALLRDEFRIARRVRGRIEQGGDAADLVGDQVREVAVSASIDLVKDHARGGMS